MSLKVLHLISGGDKGGAKTHIFSLMKGLEDLCHAKIICFIKDSFYYEAKDLGIDIEVLEQKNRADMSVVDEIIDRLDEGSYDLVHSHGARANTVAYFLKRKISMPMITTIHSDYKLDFQSNFYKKVIFTSINKIALKKFDYYIAITKDFKSMLVDRGFDENKIYLMYNGIDTSTKKVRLDREEYFKENAISNKHDIYLGQAARLDRVKNVSMTLKALKVLKDQGIDSGLILAGDGEERAELEKLARSLSLENSVYFLGFIDDKYSFFNSIDINILSSLSESFPYAILEAALMKKASVATRVGGIGEQIQDGKTGFLVESNEPVMMAEKIQILYENPHIREEFEDQMYKRVTENFSIEAMGKRQFEIYEDILERSRVDDKS